MTRELFALKAAAYRAIRGESQAHIRARMKREKRQMTESKVWAGVLLPYGVAK